MLGGGDDGEDGVWGDDGDGDGGDDVGGVNGKRWHTVVRTLLRQRLKEAEQNDGDEGKGVVVEQRGLPLQRQQHVLQPLGLSGDGGDDERDGDHHRGGCDVDYGDDVGADEQLPPRQR